MKIRLIEISRPLQVGNVPAAVEIDGRIMINGKTGGADFVSRLDQPRVVTALQNWEKMKCVG